MNQPVIIFSALNNILHIYRIILYLIKNQIPFFNKHLMIFIRWNVRFFKKRKTLRHMIQGADCCYYFLLLCAGGIFINLSHKPNMRSQHSLCPVRNNYFVLFICHSLYLCNHILKICIQFIYCASTSTCHSGKSMSLIRAALSGFQSPSAFWFPQSARQWSLSMQGAYAFISNPFL